MAWCATNANRWLGAQPTLLVRSEGSAGVRGCQENATLGGHIVLIKQCRREAWTSVSLVSGRQWPQDTFSITNNKGRGFAVQVIHEGKGGAR